MTDDREKEPVKLLSSIVGKTVSAIENISREDDYTENVAICFTDGTKVTLWGGECQYTGCLIVNGEY